MKALGSVHLSVTPSLILLQALIVTSKCHVPRLFGFKLSQTALFVQAAFYFLWFYVVILKIFVLMSWKVKYKPLSYFVSFGHSQSVLKIPVCEFVHFQVFSPALADRVEEPLVWVPVPVPVRGLEGLDLLVDVVTGLALLLAPWPAQAPGRNIGHWAETLQMWDTQIVSF